MLPSIKINNSKLSNNKFNNKRKQKNKKINFAKLINYLKLQIYSYKITIILIISGAIIIFSIGMGVGLGYFKKYEAWPNGLDYKTFKLYDDNNKVNFDSYNNLMNGYLKDARNKSTNITLNEILNDKKYWLKDWNSTNIDFSGQLFFFGNSASVNSRDEIDVNSKRWKSIKSNLALYKYTHNDGPLAKWGEEINQINNKLNNQNDYISSVRDFINQNFNNYYVYSQDHSSEKSKKSEVYPGEIQNYLASMFDQKQYLHNPYAIYDDRWNINTKDQMPGTKNITSNLIYKLLSLGTTITQNGRTAYIDDNNNFANIYLEDPFIDYVNLNQSYTPYIEPTPKQIKDDPFVYNKYFSDHVSNSFVVSSNVANDPSQNNNKGSQSIDYYPLIGILDQHAYYYKPESNNEKIYHAKLFLIKSKLDINQLIDFYYWIFSAPSYDPSSDPNIDANFPYWDNQS